MNPCNQSYDKDIFFISSENKCIERFISQSSDNDLWLSQYYPLECESFFYEQNKDSILETGTDKITILKSFTYYAGLITYENVTRTFNAKRV